ncbi:MAG TPA: hypothetical protein PKD76_10360 [Solirubrobacterales bacterium]|nr:hypothetical protein [Solirubrobacterales bacterium]
MEEAFLSDDQREQIRAKSVPEPGIYVIDRLGWHTTEVVDRETRAYDEDEGDDSMLTGQACTKKPKNLTKRDIQDSGDGRFDGVQIVKVGMGIYFDAAGVKIHLISAPQGPAGLRLSDSGIQGGIEARAEATEQMFSTDLYETKPEDVLVMFSRDLSGLDKVWVGRRTKASQFAWLIDLYDRGEDRATEIVRPASQIPPAAIKVPDVRLKSDSKNGRKGLGNR